MLTGDITYPEDLKDFNKEKFYQLERLPEIISNIDINIAPIEYSILNNSKSDIKWVEASLVKIPTIASNIETFKQMILHNGTGMLFHNMHHHGLLFNNIKNTY